MANHGTAHTSAKVSNARILALSEKDLVGVDKHGWSDVFGVVFETSFNKTETKLRIHMQYNNHRYLAVYSGPMKLYTEYQVKRLMWEKYVNG